MTLFYLLPSLHVTVLKLLSSCLSAHPEHACCSLLPITFKIARRTC